MFTDNTNLTMPVMPAGNYGYGFGGGFGNDIISLAIIAMIFGWGGYGGGFGGNYGGIAQGYTLASDFATQQRQLSDGFGGVEKGLDAIRNGLCDGFYTEAQLVNGVNMNIMQNANALGTQLADCCCRTQQNIKDTQYLIGSTGAGIQEAIKDCCCQEQAQFAQARYEGAAQHCETLQAVDKLGDRILGYMANEKNQALRDENFALKLQASQIAQNQYLVGQLAPKPPIPAFVVPNPFGLNGNYGYGFNGTTIA